MAQTPAETLELLLEVGRLLSSKLDIDELLLTVLQLSSRVVGSESASLLLLDEKTKELYFDVALGLGEEASRVRLKLGQGIAGCVAQERKPAIINDVRKDPRWSPKMDKQSGFITRSILAVPMLIKGRLIGVVEAINKRQGSFSNEDLRTFEAFASQASVAIDNARLFSSLKEEKFKLDTVFTEMNDGAILADGAGKILLSNEAARKLLGVGTELATIAEGLKDMVVTPSLHELMTGDKETTDFAAAREKPKKLILAGKITRLDLVSPTGAGGAKAGGRTGWLCVFRDETEEWQKERLKRTFLSLISHKLKTPLASVIGFSEILVEEFKGSPADSIQVKAAQTISTQGRKLGDLVEKLLRYTTLESPEGEEPLAPCPVDEIVGGALEALKDWLKRNKASVGYEPAAGVVILCEKAQMTEVVKNLIENAAKFDPKPEKKVSVWVEATPAWAALKVQDTGPGIPPEDQDKIFSQFHQIETFFTGQVDGWGLGLPFVKKVVERHGGKVELKSKLGQGTTVSVILPRKTP